MKKLMFAVPGLVTIAALSGCGTQTGPFKGSDGTVLTTPTGAEIVVVDARSESPVLDPLPENATYAERQARQKQLKTQRVQILRTDAETTLLIRESVTKSVIAEVRRLITEKGLEGIKQVVVFVDGRPQVSLETITRLAPKSVEGKTVTMTEGVVVALRAVIEKDLVAALEQDGYSRLVDLISSRIDPVVREAVTAGNFAKARELIWAASTTGIPFVDAAVRAKAVELMHGLVNPANWQKLEPEIQKITEAALQAKKYDEGAKELKELEVSSVVREYSAFIDKKLEAVKAELVKIGIKEEDMASIMDAQAAIIAAAANIVDVCDEYKTLEDARKDSVEVEARKDPALADYYKSLDSFHETLVKYNCTAENADKIVTDLDQNLLALIKLLSTSAKVETTESDGKRALQLGTKSLNTRIHGLVEESIKKLMDAKAADERAALLARQQAAKADLEAKVRACVAEGKFEEARELVWNAAITGDAAWDSEMFAFGLTLLRDIVNPADWARIEKEITAKFTELSTIGKFTELEAYLSSYPLIRQHTVKLDEQLARVRAEAEALGASPEKAEAIAKSVCENMVTEAEQLVDHLDEIVAAASDAGGEVDKSKFEKELEIYAVKLAAYHATDENVTKIVAKLRTELGALIANPENPRTTRLMLGTNAVNDRIKSLTAKLLASIAQTKTAWEDQEHARLVTDLEKRVREAVREGRFDDARNAIRDEKLIGRQDLDLSLYELRIGLLDSCVNPAQLDALLAEIDAKIAAFVDAEDYAGALKYIEDYPYVHDQYEQIDAALAAVKAAMLALEIAPNEAEKDAKVRFFASIQELLEKRRESWKPERDLSNVEKALSEVAKALFEHLNKHPELIESERRAEYAHILADIAALDRTITTWELNQRLRERLTSFVENLTKKLAVQNYAKLLSEIDAEVSFDSQIAIAEEAISRQLGVKCDRASFKVNALLGEYARVFRLVKKTGNVTPEQATTMLLGAAYLDQAQVLKRALELGADVNGVSARDPRGRTALALAVDTGHSGLVAALVNAGADLSATDKDGNAVIHYAAKSGNISVLRAIVAGAAVNVKNACGNTPLAIAVVRNQPAVVEFLVHAVAEESRTAFVDSANNEGETAFNIAAKFGSRDVLDVLSAAGATYSTKDLIIAEKADHVAVAQWLVNQGLDVNAEGVMAAACPATQTGRYLVSEGGVCAGHACDICKPKHDDKEGVPAETKANCSCKPVPVDVLLVPQCTK